MLNIESTHQPNPYKSAYHFYIIPTELIFKYDILREAASNFKEENKLGEGGFGSVFKVSV